MRSWVFILLCAAVFPAGLNAKPPSKKKPQRAKPAPAKPAATPAATPVALAPGELPLAATGAIVINAYTGQTLYEKNAGQQHYPASATKILTALLVIEAGDLDKQVTIELADTKVEPSAIGFKPGDSFTRRELLYGLMLKSANDVAQALARDNAGSLAAFGEKMTRRAGELGAASSHFMNPHGLHHPEHYTTPLDLALIARAAMQQPFFRQLVSTQTHQWAGQPAVVELRNHNKLLWKFPGCTGLKTGYTVPAQQVLVSSALWGCREVIAVVMHSNRPGIWDDSKLLLTYGFEHPPQ